MNRGVPEVGRLVGGKAPLKNSKLLKVISHIKTSILVMKAMKLDKDLRKLPLVEIVQT